MAYTQTNQAAAELSILRISELPTELLRKKGYVYRLTETPELDYTSGREGQRPYVSYPTFWAAVEEVTGMPTLYELHKGGIVNLHYAFLARNRYGKPADTFELRQYLAEIDGYFDEAIHMPLTELAERLTEDGRQSLLDPIFRTLALAYGVWIVPTDGGRWYGEWIEPTASGRWRAEYRWLAAEGEGLTLGRQIRDGSLLLRRAKGKQLLIFPYAKPCPTPLNGERFYEIDRTRAAYLVLCE